MDDIAVTGSGLAVRECRDVLERAGWRVATELRDGQGCPVILGEAPYLFQTALRVIEEGRHLLLASPAALSPIQLDTLIGARKRRQALFIWNERRFHPGFKLVHGLVESKDPAWEPRYLRLTTLTPERPSAGALRWRVMEVVALALQLIGEPARSVASLESGPARGGPDFCSIALEFDAARAFVHVGLGEGLERRETMVAATDRKAYIDEVNQTVPVRLIDDTHSPEAGGAARWVSCPSPSASELARQQCLAFLSATQDGALTEAEIELWSRAARAWRAVEASLAEGGRPVSVPEGESRGLRVIEGRGQSSSPRAPSLRVVLG